MAGSPASGDSCALERNSAVSAPIASRPTTIKFYCGLETMAATQQFGKLIREHI
jgi:hypothetical protein